MYELGNYNSTGKISVSSGDIEVMTMSLFGNFSKYELSEYFLLEPTACLKQCVGIIIEDHTLDYKNTQFTIEQHKEIFTGYVFTITLEDGPLFITTKD